MIRQTHVAVRAIGAQGIGVSRGLVHLGARARRIGPVAVEERSVMDHAAQTRFSDPGGHAALFDEIEPTIDDVSSMARNVVAHYRARAADLPESTRDDISLRWVDSILATDQQRNASSLRVERQIRDRVQGCCRDHTLLAVAALRHHGVPARSRVGFASYLSPTWNHDHVVVEAWLEGRWRRFDAEFAEPVGSLVDPTDIPRGSGSAFLTAARVWLAHRAGEIDVTRFGVAEEIGVGGDWFVHSYVIAEVAHRFGDELLLWDVWGAMGGDLADVAPEDIELVDEIARLLVRADDGDVGAEQALLDRYRGDGRLHPGEVVRSLSPNGGRYEVDLLDRTTERLDERPGTDPSAPH